MFLFVPFVRWKTLLIRSQATKGLKLNWKKDTKNLVQRRRRQCKSQLNTWRVLASQSNDNENKNEKKEKKTKKKLHSIGCLHLLSLFNLNYRRAKRKRSTAIQLSVLAFSHVFFLLSFLLISSSSAPAKTVNLWTTTEQLLMFIELANFFHLFFSFRSFSLVCRALRQPCRHMTLVNEIQLHF